VGVLSPFSFIGLIFMENCKLVIIVLTFNESLHLRRCLDSLRIPNSKIIVVDSFSTDDTEEIANQFNAVFLRNCFVSHSQQFNYALSQILHPADWVLRIDADEYLTPELRDSLCNVILSNSTFNGFTVDRRMIFSDRFIRFGGVFPSQTLRLFRFGYGSCEDRWMDEHIVVNGCISHLYGALIDHNLITDCP